MRNYTQLTLEDRHKFINLVEMKLPMTEIARRMNFHRSTLYRELRRNKTDDIYKPIAANSKMHSRKQRKGLIQKHYTLREYINRNLKNGWSPEQISGRLKRKKSKYIICHETIYRYIYKHNQKLHTYLPYKKPKRLKPHSRKPQKCRFGEKRLITQRLPSIDKRLYTGHWEGDLIEFKGNKKITVTTLVERKTRYVSLLKNESRYSDEVMGKIYSFFSTSLSEQVCKSITFDQGGDFASFHLLEGPLKSKIYYCHVHSPWEKGSNENMNGRLRWDCLPKNADINKISQEELNRIAKRMNDTPRKCLDYKTPKEVFLRRYPEICRTSL